MSEPAANSGVLAGRHALVTGAAGGIGLAVAKARLEQGARGTGIDLRAAPASELQAVPEDIAGAAVFLASAAASYITAQTLNVDGGSVMS